MAAACPLVTLLPPRPMQALMPLYREADVFLLPSRRETFGLVYAEAISQGLPVLYGRGQGFDGQFEDGRVGYAVDPDDPVAIADKVLSILGDYARFSASALAGSARFVAEAYPASEALVAGACTRRGGGRQMKRLVVVTKEYPSPGEPVYPFVEQLVNALADLGVEITVISRSIRSSAFCAARRRCRRGKCGARRRAGGCRFCGRATCPLVTAAWARCAWPGGRWPRLSAPSPDARPA